MSPYEVALQCDAYLREIADQHDLCTACLKIVSRQQDYVENVMVLMHQKNGFDPEKVAKITPAFIRELMASAGKTESDGFSILCRSTLVALCGGLENFIKDYVAANILSDPAHCRNLNGRSFKVPASSLVLSTDEERVAFVVDELYRDEGTKTGHTNLFLRLLEYVDQRRNLDTVIEMRTDLDEAYVVRNAIVHNGGRIDQRLASKVPRFAPEVGNTIQMNEQTFRRYRNALLKFAGQIISAEL